VGKGRVEAFSDAVIAILITIMVLELKVPHGTDASALRPLLPVFLSYLLSFVFLGIYWNNHHHLWQVVRHVNGRILWANMHLLFWLSMIPFVTAWMGENDLAALPVALYGVVLLFAGVAYFILTRVLIAHHDKDSALVKAIGDDFKGRISVVIYAVGILLAFAEPRIACALYVAVAAIWLVPDPRIEKAIVEKSPPQS